MIFFVFNKRHNHSPLCVIIAAAAAAVVIVIFVADIVFVIACFNKIIMQKNRIATLNFNKKKFFLKKEKKWV